jgi:hypothetical protein
MFREESVLYSQQKQSTFFSINSKSIVLGQETVGWLMLPVLGTQKSSVRVLQEMVRDM